MEKPSHRYRRMANDARAFADKWLKFLKSHPEGTDEQRIVVARQHRKAMADARKYDELALKWKELGR